MNTEKINNLATTIKSLKSAKFYLVNGWGIISFKSDVEFTASRNAICFMDGKVSSKESFEFIQELNEAINPVLVKYSIIAEKELKKECEK